MILVIGSVALNWHKQTRTPVDIDLVARYDDAVAYVKMLSTKEKVLANYPSDAGKKIIVKTDKRIVEIEVAWEGSTAEGLLQLAQAETSVHEGCYIPCLDLLYAIKMSHRYRKDSIHFDKTRKDILLMRSFGAKIRPEHEEWLKWRESETYKNVLPKLNQSKKDFFDNSASIYTLDHDSIHEAVKHLVVPAYEYFKPDNSEVFTSKEMFFDCPREVRIYAALEEVMVLSIERSVHPFELKGDKRRWAFDMAHMKLATSISSGWFREFVWENYDEVQAMYSEEYIEKFYTALHNGLIKPFEG